MTDNEIVKALECCKLTNEQQESQCEDCPLWETSLMICQELLAFHALDLINRQKAEIERLEAENKKLKLEMSYMKNPNTIGDIHEMGVW